MNYLTALDYFAWYMLASPCPLVSLVGRFSSLWLDKYISCTAALSALPGRKDSARYNCISWALCVALHTLHTCSCALSLSLSLTLPVCLIVLTVNNFYARPPTMRPRGKSGLCNANDFVLSF